MAQVGETVKAGVSVVGKIYKILWLITVIGFIVVLGGFYLEFRKLNSQIAEVRTMVNTLGEQLVGAAKWQQKATTEIDKLEGQGGDLLKKLGK